MKLKQLGIGTLALGLLTGGGYSYSAFASSNEDIVENEKQSVESNLEIFEPGETPEIPEGAIKMEKVVQGEEESVESNLETFEPGEMPEIPKGATQMKKTVLDEEKKGE
ncbi:hypothetical protein [Peribacillus simplex]|uniref:hypothetical protein n=1 Tax=Peribacillus simplex TaxID=1478 RepID=UPI0011DCC953|nr:hypothetical protein [Peribacillus simplex]